MGGCSTQHVGPSKSKEGKDWDRSSGEKATEELPEVGSEWDAAAREAGEVRQVSPAGREPSGWTP